MDSCLDPFCTKDCKSASNFVTQTGWSYTGKGLFLSAQTGPMADFAAGLTGASMSIGVFLWGTGSTIDHAVFASRPSPDRFLRLPEWNKTERTQVAAGH